MRGTNNPPVTVAIVNWNGGESFRRCLDLVLKHDYEPMDILVVDNASTDGSVDRVDRSKVRLIINDVNRGSAGG